MDTPWRARLSKACLCYVIPRSILGTPPGVDSPASPVRYTTNPALGEEPVTGFVVKWAILDSNQ